MGLYERILGEPGFDTDVIPVDVIVPWIAETQRGKLLRANLDIYFNLDAGEQVEATTLGNRIGTQTGKITLQELEHVLRIATYPRPPYDATHRLGINNPYGTVATLKARLGV